MPKNKKSENVVKMNSKIINIEISVKDLLNAETALQNVVKFPALTGLLTYQFNKNRKIVSDALDPFKETRKEISQKLISEWEKENPDSKGKNLLDPVKFDKEMTPLLKQKVMLEGIKMIDGEKFFYEKVGDKKVERFDSDLESTEMNGIGQYVYDIMWMITDVDS